MDVWDAVSLTLAIVAVVINIGVFVGLIITR